MPQSLAQSPAQLGAIDKELDCVDPRGDRRGLGQGCGEMLGEDDWFDKMSAAGRDYARFNYMQQLLAFTEKQKRAILAGAD